ncbi:orotidine-5'-phosphate decarboxylase [Microbacterium sp. Marseille-Q6965]|uniref:orotidine-5'-phosphate decarboxylase n=1 Tax=Microbacterium sp. Marseille-Q6965 TaxID=2965072 RepID=UPI0021B83BFB|nr:orotidine-5'-phosphate decarboxylase [Microbacterium sp. Marseille-Q6965]
MTVAGFGARVRDAIARHGRLCVGIDPHAPLLAAWGLPDSAGGARDLGLRVVDAAAGVAAVVKPQVSFFERHGSAGLAALEQVLAAARAAGLIAIADAKRGDIGSTMDAYAEAWLRPGAALEADAVTASPYLGVGSLTGTFDLAYREGKGVFVLAATSNPEARGLQGAIAGGDTVAARVVSEVAARNAAEVDDDEWGSLGLVIGATVDWADAGLRPFAPAAPILAPGFGHQGAVPSDLNARFGALAPCVLASESRSILSAGPAGIADAIRAATAAYRAGEESHV